MEGNGRRTFYGADSGPHFNADGTFNGHTLLVVPEASRFLDPTIQQYAEVPATEQAKLPVMARLPARAGMGAAAMEIARPGHRVVYRPVPAHQRDAWRSPITAHDAVYRRAAANLAANVLDDKNYFNRQMSSPCDRCHLWYA